MIAFAFKVIDTKIDIVEEATEKFTRKEAGLALLTLKKFEQKIIDSYFPDEPTSVLDPDFKDEMRS